MWLVFYLRSLQIVPELDWYPPMDLGILPQKISPDEEVRDISGKIILDIC